VVRAENTIDSSEAANSTPEVVLLMPVLEVGWRTIFIPITRDGQTTWLVQYHHVSIGNQAALATTQALAVEALNNNLSSLYGSGNSQQGATSQALKTGFRIAMQSNHVIEPGYNVTLTEIQRKLDSLYPDSSFLRNLCINFISGLLRDTYRPAMAAEAQDWH
jgi:hypothetical protein